MTEWTQQDEEELVDFENELKRREFMAKNAPLMVGGAMTLVVVGLITLVVLMF
ncbi:MAG: hypothetical protein ACXAC5_05315 [Promethearchaeota archaeon]|jgi:hypothetical protein